MPYSGVTEARKKHPNLKKYSAKARRGWVSAFNNAIESGKDESSAFAIAYSVANKVDGKESINASLRFTSENEALQYLSDFTGKRVFVAAEIGNLDIAQFIKDVEAMADVEIDDFIEDIEDLIDASQSEADVRKNMETPTTADLLMAALLQAISKRSQEYYDDVEEFEKVDDLSKEFKSDIETLIERYNKGQQEVLAQQEAAEQQAQAI